MEGTDQALKALATNGPWAVMFGFLLLQVLKAWGSDRSQLTELIGKFQLTLEGLKTVVEHLIERLNDDIQRNKL